MENRVKLILSVLVIQVITIVFGRIYDFNVPAPLFPLILIVFGIFDGCFNTKFSKWCDSKKIFKIE